MPRRYHDSEPVVVYAPTGRFKYTQRIRTAMGATVPAPDQYQGHVSPSARSEIQKVDVRGTPTGGTFVLIYGGVASAPIPFDASAPQVQAALEGIADVGAGNVLVEGPDGGPWKVTYQNALKNTNVPMLTSDFTGLTGGTFPSITVLQAQVGSPSGAKILPSQTGRDDIMPNLLIIAEAPAIGMLNAEDGYSAFIRTGQVSIPPSPAGAEENTRSLWRKATRPRVIRGWQ